MPFDCAREVDVRHSAFQVINQTINITVACKKKLTRLVRKLANVSQTGLFGSSDCSEVCYDALSWICPEFCLFALLPEPAISECAFTSLVCGSYNLRIRKQWKSNLNHPPCKDR